jgi:hypothetical protein
MPEKETKAVREITVEQVKAPGLTAQPTTGALGGPHPDGESITAHVYYESGTVAGVAYYPVNENRVDLTKARFEKTSHMTRFIHTTLVMSPFAARHLGEWLIQQSDAADAIRAATETEDREESS